MSRISKEEYYLELAETAAKRSEDPYLQVGAVAVTIEGRVIATGYNGLPPGYTASNKFWEDRDMRLLYMIHAEQNLCSLFKRGEAWLVALTHNPCASCIMTLLAHGIERVIFRDYYHRDQRAEFIAQKYDMAYEKIETKG